MTVAGTGREDEHVRMRRAVLIPVIAVVVAATACTVEVSAHTLVVHDAQENFFGDGDEPYLAVVKWRVIPGTAGSASAEFIGNLEELSGDADAGESFPVPASMGSVSFAGVQWSSTAALLQGRLPELTGTVMVAMESDLTPWGTINAMPSPPRPPTSKRRSRPESGTRSSSCSDRWAIPTT